MESQNTGSTHETLELGWQKPQGLLGLSFKIFFLRILTLGIYHFWGKTEVRRRIWNAIRINDEPLEYMGTGKELFLGFLFVVFLVLIPLFAIMIGSQLLLGQGNPLAVVVMVAVYMVFFYLFGVAVYRARRYRLSRTRWRGIRGTMSGSPWAFGLTYFWTLLLIVPTLGWSLPWMQVKLQKILTDDMRFGNQPFHFNGSAKELYKRFAVPWFGGLIFYGAIGSMAITQQSAPNPQMILIFATVAGLGLVLLIIAGFWYKSKAYNYFAASTSFGDARFSLATTAGGLIGLLFMNLLILIVSLGIALPIIQARIIRYFVTRMDVEGSVDMASILQAQDQMDKTGEGLAEALDIDIF
jgi:uncharacterized membrane protein YjgN (DUF898 family)